MNAHIPMLLTLTSILLLTVITAACALAYAVLQGALDSRVRIDADVRILPAATPALRPITPVCSRATCLVMLAASRAELHARRAAKAALDRAFDAMLTDVDAYIRVHVLATKFQHMRFAS